MTVGTLIDCYKSSVCNPAFVLQYKKTIIMMMMMIVIIIIIITTSARVLR